MTDQFAVLDTVRSIHEHSKKDVRCVTLPS
jgi:hypothetical protein